jgi:hypothetical protein
LIEDDVEPAEVVTKVTITSAAAPVPQAATTTKVVIELSHTETTKNEESLVVEIGGDGGQREEEEAEEEAEEEVGNKIESTVMEEEVKPLPRYLYWTEEMDLSLAAEVRRCMFDFESIAQKLSEAASSGMFGLATKQSVLSTAGISPSSIVCVYVLYASYTTNCFTISKNLRSNLRPKLILLAFCVMVCVTKVTEEDLRLLLRHAGCAGQL